MNKRKDPCGVESPDVFVEASVFTHDLHVTNEEEDEETSVSVPPKKPPYKGTGKAFGPDDPKGPDPHERLEMFPPNSACVAYGLQVDRQFQRQYTVIYHAKHMDTLEAHLFRLRNLSNGYPLVQCIRCGDISDWPNTFSALEKELEERRYKEQKQNVYRTLPVTPSNITLHVFPKEALDVLTHFFIDLKNREDNNESVA